MTTYTVANGNDSGAGSLRAAIALSNANPGADIIELRSNVELNSTIEITDSLSLIGNDNTVISQTGRNRLFKVDDGLADNHIEVSLENLTLTGGNATAAGGAILLAEDLNITNSQLTDNQSGDFGGAIAIANGGSLSITDSAIIDNTAGDYGGAIGVEQNSTVEIVNTIVSRNSAAFGGGISSSKENNRIEIVDSKVTDNSEPNIVGDGFTFITTQEGVSLLGDTVHRFFEPNLGGHFYTANETEKNYVIDNLTNYQYEGESYRAVNPEAGEAEEVYRFFNSQTGFHFYTTDEGEKDYINDKLNHFTYEGIVFHAYQTPLEGSISIYRFYEPTLGTHFYTASEMEMILLRDNLSDYHYEGIAYYAMPTDDGLM